MRVCSQSGGTALGCVKGSDHKHLENEAVYGTAFSNMEPDTWRQLHGRSILAPAIQHLLPSFTTDAMPNALPHRLLAA